MKIRFLPSELRFKNLHILVVFIFALLVSIIQSAPSHAATPPSAPQYVEAMTDSNQVAITWDPPNSNGGEVLLTYTVRIWSAPPPTSSPMFASCVTTNLGCIIGGVIPGVIYYVDAIASNSAGPSAPSAAKSISPGAAGKPPTNVSAMSDSKGLLTIKWTPLSALTAGAFAWYTAEVFTSSEMSIGSYSGFCTASAISESSCLIGGLKLGGTYYAQVRTISSLGSGYPSWPRFKIVAGTAASVAPSPSPTQVVPSATTSSAPSASATPANSSKATPIATGLASSSFPPQAVKVTALSKAIRVSWSAPKYTGGLKILGYRVEAVGGSGLSIYQCRTSAKVLTCTLKNLEPKLPYNLAVYVVFSGKESPSSKIFRVVTKS